MPQLPEVSRAMRAETGWEVAPVPALIPLSGVLCPAGGPQVFPAATFVRTRDQLNYLQEPDIFHEIFGHTPLLTNRYFADFTHAYGKLGLAAGREERVILARMYWFTVEFGLLQKPGGPLQVYGGGILSSIGETGYVYSGKPARASASSLLESLRTLPASTSCSLCTSCWRICASSTS